MVLPKAESFEAQQGDSGEYFIGKKGSEIVGYVFTTSSPSGYGGAISVMTGIQTDGQISGVVILSHNETPGLGANAEKEDYRNQYLQKAAEGGFTLIKTGTPGEGQILAMTGATIPMQ